MDQNEKHRNYYHNNEEYRKKKLEKMKEWREKNKEYQYLYNFIYNRVTSTQNRKTMFDIHYNYIKYKTVPEPPKYTIDGVGKRYVDRVALTRELIISKGKGKITPLLHKGFHLLITNMLKKFNLDEDTKKDYYQAAYLRLLQTYKNYNEDKYENGFTYLSEIIKRAFTKEFKNSFANWDYKIGYVEVLRMDNFSYQGDKF